MDMADHSAHSLTVELQRRRRRPVPTNPELTWTAWYRLCIDRSPDADNLIRSHLARREPARAETVCFGVLAAAAADPGQRRHLAHTATWLWQVICDHTELGRPGVHAVDHLLDLARTRRCRNYLAERTQARPDSDRALAYDAWLTERTNGPEAIVAARLELRDVTGAYRAVTGRPIGDVVTLALGRNNTAAERQRLSRARRQLRQLQTAA
jgi:hypothetical protein